MIDYGIFLDALAEGPVERRTSSVAGSASIWQGGKLLSGEDGAYDLTETIVPEPVFVLFGAGHVGKALYDMATVCGIRTIVLDDRPGMASEERFPLAERHTGPFPELLEAEYHALPCYIIFTHGHACDLECLRYALRRPAMYIGMIGSARKVRAQYDILRDEGFTEEDLSRVHAPIGLDINAVTPAEIAVSILAEIIRVSRKDRKSIRISSDLLREMSRNDGIEVRIIAKEGSGPQEPGAAMFVEEGRVFSTIGGGMVEKLAAERARKMLAGGEDTAIGHYDLSEGGNAAMICGGSLTLLFSRVRH